MEELKHLITSIYPVTAPSVKSISELVTYRELRNKTVFVEKGKRNNHEYFLIEGVCRSFLLSPEGEEVTISFFNEGSIISPYVTRTINGISNINIQCLTDLVVGEMNAEEFEQLMVENLEIREFGNLVLKLELQKKVQKEINMTSLPALDRLRIFRNDFPGFENIVPHPTISSYLGITSVSLSRLRKKQDQDLF